MKDEGDIPLAQKGCRDTGYPGYPLGITNTGSSGPTATRGQHRRTELGFLYCGLSESHLDLTWSRNVIWVLSHK